MHLKPVAAYQTLKQCADEADIFVSPMQVHSSPIFEGLKGLQAWMQIVAARCAVIGAAAKMLEILHAAAWLQSCTVEVDREDGLYVNGVAIPSHVITVDEAKFVGGKAPGNACDDDDLLPRDATEAEITVSGLLAQQREAIGAALLVDDDQTHLSFELSRAALAHVLAAPPSSSVAAARVLWPALMAALDARMAAAVR